MKKETADTADTKGTQSQSLALAAFVTGASYFIRTVTYHLTGRLKAIDGAFLILEECSWIADSGRFSDAINNGMLSEVEPVNGLVRVNMNSITDAFDWKHELPRTRK